VSTTKLIIRKARTAAGILRSYGAVNGLRESTALVLRRLLDKRRMLPPRVSDLMARSSAYPTGLEALNAIWPRTEGDVEADELVAEFKELQEELRARYEVRRLNAPATFAVESESSFLIYAITRLLKPRAVLETGVANGHSTYFLLNAVEKNGLGYVSSVEVSHDVGALIEGDDLSNWTLHVLGRRDRRRSFAAVVATLPSIDLFIHDSDHTYAWQMSELTTAFRRASDDSFWVVDDADSSFAFLDFCERLGSRPTLLLDARKFLGILHWSSSDQ
jgi:hypothetical protein